MRLLLPLLLCFSCVTAKPVVGPDVIDFFIDNAGRKYYLLSDDRFITYNELGQNHFSYYDSSLGAPGGIDVSDPFAILLFYPEYGTVVVVDRTLSEVSRIDLFSLKDVRQPEVIARASNQGIWIFDSWDNRLKLLDPQGTLRLQSNDLKLELRPTSSPVALYVDRSTVLLHYAEENKLAVFTNYGRFERWVELPAAEQLGWRAPILTGNSSAGHWAYRAGNDTAGPQVQSGLRGKLFDSPEGIYYLDDLGEAQLKTKEK
ncbi:hypothetical protein FUA23_14635 [Neolewinella aurantiaca]|uniref:Uncharacterized protein n=1 Tax=Neolewinella aurantiaca TaxID=2602767 RepID=A0A5C7FE51_9BACT|nr:hypothetical protein [Neolewinella aurantiaca]TXF88518.1 hypothetical protein FUA23_14635 [Neolewinella aurantiaca]